MGFLSKLRPQAYSLADFDHAMTMAKYGVPSSTGIQINDDAAMRSMAVHSCIKIKADSIKQLPCHMMEEVDGPTDSTGKTSRIKRKARGFYLYDLLHYQPNSWMTADMFWGMASACLDLRGNFYALKRGIEGRPIQELIPLAPDTVEEVVQGPDYGLIYKVRRPAVNGVSTIVDLIPGNKIMHIRGMTLDGFRGLNPIEYARESIGLALATEKHGAKLFSHGTMIGGVIEFPATVAPFKTLAAMREYLKDFNEIYSSVGNAHKAAILQQGATWKPMAMTSVDSQFLEARGFQKKEIVDLFFGLPLSMLTTGDKTSTYASAGAFAQDYVNYALLPRLVSFEYAIWKDLLTAEEKKRYYAKFAVGGLLRGNMTERFAAYQVAINSQILNPNEVRDLEDMNPYEGGNTYETRTSTVKQDGNAPPPDGTPNPPADKGATP